MDYLQGFYIDWVKELYYGGKRKFASQGLQTSRHKFRGVHDSNFLKKAVGLYRRVFGTVVSRLPSGRPFKVDWKWILIAFMAGVIISGHRLRVIPEQKPLPAVYTKRVALLQAVLPAKAKQVVLKPVPPPVPAYVAPAPVVTSCPIITSSDPYVQDVLNVESGGNTCAMNPSGACGAFQRLPCDVPLGNASVQLADGLAYIASTYGSSYNAWLHELNYGWY